MVVLRYACICPKKKPHGKQKKNDVKLVTLYLDFISSILTSFRVKYSNFHTKFKKTVCNKVKNKTSALY